MNVDWLTVAAQIANFLVLVWLLQRFLYGPIVRAMDRREQRIAERLAEAERAKAEAAAEAQSFRDKQQALEQQSEQMLAEARDSAESTRRSLEHAAREAVAARRKDWEDQLEAQHETFLRDLRIRTTEEFYALAKRALSDLADAELEEQMALAFVAQLERLDQASSDKLAEACAASNGRVLVRSHFELSPGARRLIAQAVHERISADANVDYRTEPAVSCGIELKTGSQTMVWSLDSYFIGLEKAVEEQLMGHQPAAGESREATAS